jgi:hypothetical protein
VMIDSEDEEMRCDHEMGHDRPRPAASETERWLTTRHDAAL